jgi:hypothetical protein
MVRLAAPAVLLLLAAGARADAQLDMAREALRSDRSLKVRAQAAIVLGQRGGPDSVPALLEALERDREPAVRLAAAGALGRIGGREARRGLDAAARSDADPRVRDAASRALAALALPSLPASPAAPASPGAAGAPAAVLVLSIEETSGTAGCAATRAAFRDSLVRHLRDRGFRVVEQGAGYRLKPSILRVDVESGAGTTVIAVKTSLVAVDGGGRMAAMLESGARLKATGSLPGAAVERYAARAVDAAARTLSEDLAARLQ